MVGAGSVSSPVAGDELERVPSAVGASLKCQSKLQALALQKEKPVAHTAAPRATGAVPGLSSERAWHVAGWPCSLDGHVFPRGERDVHLCPVVTDSFLHDPPALTLKALSPPHPLPILRTFFSASHGLPYLQDF